MLRNTLLVGTVILGHSSSESSSALRLRRDTADSAGLSWKLKPTTNIGRFIFSVKPSDSLSAPPP